MWYKSTFNLLLRSAGIFLLTVARELFFHQMWHAYTFEFATPDLDGANKVCEFDNTLNIDTHKREIQRRYLVWNDFQQSKFKFHFLSLPYYATLPFAHDLHSKCQCTSFLTIVWIWFILPQKNFSRFIDDALNIYYRKNIFISSNL